MKNFWTVIETAAFVATLILVLVAIKCATNNGHPHWKAAAILLFVAMGTDVIASVAHCTLKALK